MTTRQRRANDEKNAETIKVSHKTHTKTHTHHAHTRKHSPHSGRWSVDDGESEIENQKRCAGSNEGDIEPESKTLVVDLSLDEDSQKESHLWSKLLQNSKFENDDRECGKETLDPEFPDSGKMESDKIAA